MPEHLYLFANPIAGRGKGEQIAQSLSSYLQSNNYHVTLSLLPATKTPPPNSPISAALAIGGDGTLRDVVQWTLNLNSTTPIPLLAIPMGTANLMGRHLHLPRASPENHHRILLTLQRRKIVLLDAARANGQLLLMLASVGFDAQVVHEVQRRRQGPIHKLSYVLPSFQTLFKGHFPPVSVEINNQLLAPPQPAIVVVSNIREYGAGFPILPNARPNDGLLDVCILPVSSRTQLLNTFLHAIAGEHHQLPNVKIARTSSLKILSPEPLPIQIDGEPAGHTPIQISIIPQKIPFLIPPTPNPPLRPD